MFLVLVYMLSQELHTAQAENKEKKNKPESNRQSIAAKKTEIKSRKRRSPPEVSGHKSRVNHGAVIIAQFWYSIILVGERKILLAAAAAATSRFNGNKIDNRERT